MGKDTILVVDDDKEIVQSIEIYLESENMNILKAYDGIECLNIFNKEKIDMVIIDVMMPNLDGIRTVKKIRENSNIPIIFLSAKSEEMDKILGLNIGADDYMTKPFSILELVARIKSNMRRYKTLLGKEIKTEKEVLEVRGLELNIFSKELKLNGENIKITPIEFKILKLLMSNLNRVFSSDEIYERVWNERCINSDTVMVHIRRIREKIEVNPKNPIYLKVVWGSGYKIEK
ncbi:response regulator transcription factor [Clostridium thermobutyricum]|uniref:response regulator transcription factor n=1 Tax=Clostridium thermobutyricum TaxID=29372 RepID=UPI003F5257BC